MAEPLLGSKDPHVTGKAFYVGGLWGGSLLRSEEGPEAATVRRLGIRQDGSEISSTGITMMTPG
jgi:hypothetical protein